MILSVKNPYKLRGSPEYENYAKVGGWSTYAYRDLTFDWQKIKCSYPAQQPPLNADMASLPGFDTSYTNG